MAKAVGIGGVFMRARDPKALGAWYQQHLGISYEHGFAAFMWRDDADADAQTLWVPFDHDTEYFGPSAQQTMVNFRVDDLAALLVQLDAAGVAILPERTDDENGKFAWIADLEGNRVELWQPIRVSK